MSRRDSETTRQQIIDTASNLFYHHGYHAVGVDKIIAEAGIAKMTLYRHFPSKDDLIVAYLRYANDQFWGWFNGVVAPYDDNPRQQLHALFEGVVILVQAPQCLGCAFQMAASEFPDHNHQAHQVAREHKEVVLARLQTMVNALGVANPDILANQLFLLLDGAWAANRMFGKQSAALSIASAAEQLINSAMH